MELNEIEHKIACHEMTAAQVFTQMKQHINAERNIAIDEAAKVAEKKRGRAECEYDRGFDYACENLAEAIRKLTQRTK